MEKDAQFFVGQKAFIRKGDEVLVLFNPHERLDFPGGKIQEGETDLAESLKREVREETGLEIVIGKPFVTWTFIFPETHRLSGKKIFLVGYECEYISGEIKLSGEHGRFVWITKENYESVNNGSPFFPILQKYFSK